MFGTDALIIGMFLPVSAITFFAIPGTLINYMRNLVGMSTWVLIPVFSELESENNAVRVKSILSGGTKFSFLVGLQVGIVYLLMGRNFISLWIGQEYGEGSAMILIILTFGTLLGLCHHVINSALYGLSRHYIIAYIRLGEAAVYVILSIIFIKMWGIISVALGMAISHVLFMGVALPIVVCRKLDIPFAGYVKESIGYPMLASIPFALCCYFVDKYYPAQNLLTYFLSVALLVPVFLFSAWFISFSKEEREKYALILFRYFPALKVLSKLKMS